MEGQELPGLLGERRLLVRSGRVEASRQIHHSRNFVPVNHFRIDLSNLVEDGLNRGGRAANIVRVEAGVEAILAVQMLQMLREERFLGGQMLNERSHGDSTAEAILVDVGSADTEANRFLEAENDLVPLRFQIQGKIPDPFESREGVRKLRKRVGEKQSPRIDTHEAGTFEKYMEALCFAHGVKESRGHVRSNHVALGGLNSGEVAAMNVPKPRSEKRCGLVAVENSPGAVALFFSDSKSVRIGIVGQNMTRTRGVRGFHGQLERTTTLFGIGILDSRKLWIGSHLLDNRNDSRQAELCENSLTELVANTMHGCVGDRSQVVWSISRKKGGLGHLVQVV
eukprot:m.228699 g.228699  ORF g.228699 m.228699 type:complete len:339 (-) comp54251_c0_seq9:620-1636(-)